LTEFSASDDVSLFIRSSMDAKNRKDFEDFIKDTTEKLLLENPKKTFPQMPQTEDALLPYLLLSTPWLPPSIAVLLFSPISFRFDIGKYLGMPSLYKSVDCLVLSSHGEGWGLPIIEAMAMVI
jgi:glycosyltransferase involved in cell wall biosynthesis